jgi:preprotein translocase subunit SecY
MLNKEILKKIMFVLFGIAIFRLGSHVPVPGVDPYALELLFNNYKGTMLDVFNTFSGGSLKRLSIFAVGIMPYITASIILYIFGFFVAHLKNLKEAGPSGQLVINRYTRYLTLIIAFFQAFGLTSTIMRETVNGGLPVVPVAGFAFQFGAIITLMAGTMTIVWLSDKITELGIGNGTSIIIYTGIISGLPQALTGTFELAANEQIQKHILAFIVFIVFASILLVTLVEKGQKRIKIVNSRNKNQSLHKVHDYLPFKINMAGVMPSVLATSVMSIPLTITQMLALSDFEILAELNKFMAHGSLGYFIMFAFLIFGFAFFLNSLQNNPKDVAKKLKDSGVFIEGFRPGDQTQKVLSKIMTRITILGSTYLLLVCLLPEFLVYYWSVPFYFGGTSLLILVSVGLEWQNQISSQMKNVHYNKIEDDIKGVFK